jgi:hypothetical protein
LNKKLLELKNSPIPKRDSRLEGRKKLMGDVFPDHTAIRTLFFRLATAIQRFFAGLIFSSRGGIQYQESA